jgi:hypothetical protein
MVVLRTLPGSAHFVEVPMFFPLVDRRSTESSAVTDQEASTSTAPAAPTCAVRVTATAAIAATKAAKRIALDLSRTATTFKSLLRTAGSRRTRTG